MGSEMCIRDSIDAHINFRVGNDRIWFDLTSEEKSVQHKNHNLINNNLVMSENEEIDPF